MFPENGIHGKTALNVGVALFQYVKQHNPGSVFSAGTGFYTTHDPDVVCSADAIYYSDERVEELGDLTGFLRLAPDLAVEVMSPGDTFTEVEEKVAEYFNAGVRLIWIVIPKTHSIHVYRPRKDALRLKSDDLLTGEDVLPGFEIKVAELFE